MGKKGILKICNRGHKFHKNSDCPICPICWSGYYRNKMNLEFPKDISAPALRALVNAKIATLQKLSTFTEKEILKLHGVGPSSIPKLKRALKSKHLSFKVKEK